MNVEFIEAHDGFLFKLFAITFEESNEERITEISLGLSDNADTNWVKLSLKLANQKLITNECQSSTIQAIKIQWKSLDDFLIVCSD
jgi:predicted nucleic acid-binding protein